MLLFSMMCAIILLIVAIFSISAVLAFRNYRYTRPKTSGARLILGTGTLSGLLLIAVILILWFKVTPPLMTTCQHPQPPLSSGNPRCVTGHLTIDGSTALQPLLQLISHDYTTICGQKHYEISIDVGGRQSQAGLNAVEDGTIDIGTSDFPASSQLSGLVDHQVAVIIFAVIVNSQVGITNLSKEQLQHIYNGQFTNWQQVGGPNLAITAFRRTTGSGTRTTFDQYVLNQSPESVSTPPTLTDTQSMVREVQETPGAIGYASLFDTLHTPELNSQLPPPTVVSIENVSPSLDQVSTNTYTFWNVEHMYTRGHPKASSLTQAFLDYMGNEHARAIAKAHSFVGINDMQSSALATRCP